MNGKRKYTEKTLVEKAKALQYLDSGMSMKACAAKYSVSVGMIINWKKKQKRDYKFYFWIHKSFLEKTCVS